MAVVWLQVSSGTSDPLALGRLDPFFGVRRQVPRSAGRAGIGSSVVAQVKELVGEAVHGVVELGRAALHHVGVV